MKHIVEETRAKGRISIDQLDQGLVEKRRRGELSGRVGKTCRDEVRELEWLGAIRLQDNQVSPSSQSIFDSLHEDFETALKDLLLKREPTLVLFLDYIRKNPQARSKEIVEDLRGRDVRDFDLSSLDMEITGIVQLNPHRLQAAAKLGQELGLLRKTSQGHYEIGTGRRASAHAAILECYQDFEHESFVSLTDLWSGVLAKFPGVAESKFDAAIVRLKDEFFPTVDLFQGKGKKSVFDPVMGRYYHLIRIDPTLIDDLKRETENWEE
jgi:hypothetical protein